MNVKLRLLVFGQVISVLSLSALTFAAESGSNHPKYRQFRRLAKPPKSIKLREQKPAEPPTGDNDLAFFGLRSLSYDKIEKSGTLPKLPWADYYWATRYGGIALRWQVQNDSEDYRDYIYRSPSINELKAMSTEQLNKLSPAEKYDIYVGRTNLNAAGSVTQMERDKVTEAAEIADGDNIPDWVGLCNGWALSANAEKQPFKPVIAKTPWGQSFEFAAADLKALLNVAYDDYQEDIFVRRLGSACDEEEGEIRVDANGRPRSLICRDINPLSLHIALSEYVGRQKKSFVVEVDKAAEVWNHPIYAYRMTYGGPETDARTGKSVLKVKTEMDYVDESVPVYHGFTDQDIRDDYLLTMTMNYTLELGANGMIVGGEWDRGSDHPDFIWGTDERPNAQNLGEGYPINMNTLRELLSKSYL